MTIDIQDSNGKKPPLKMTKSELLDKLAKVAGNVIIPHTGTPLTVVGKYSSEIANIFDLTHEEQEYLLKKLVEEIKIKEGGKDAKTKTKK